MEALRERTHPACQRFILKGNDEDSDGDISPCNAREVLTFVWPDNIIVWRAAMP